MDMYVKILQTVEVLSFLKCFYQIRSFIDRTIFVLVIICMQCIGGLWIIILYV
jgi:hypothetical protein